MTPRKSSPVLRSCWNLSETTHGFKPVQGPAVPEPGRPVRPWLYTIATNQAIDALRRNNRHLAVSLDRERDEQADGEMPNLVETLHGRGPGPLDLAQQQESRERIRASVDRLPDLL